MSNLFQHYVFHCSKCSGPVKAVIRDDIERGVIVEPCEKCLDNFYNDGYDQGYRKIMEE